MEVVRAANALVVGLPTSRAINKDGRPAASLSFRVPLTATSAITFPEGARPPVRADARRRQRTVDTLCSPRAAVQGTQRWSPHTRRGNKCRVPRGTGPSHQHDRRGVARGEPDLGPMRCSPSSERENASSRSAATRGGHRPATIDNVPRPRLVAQRGKRSVVPGAIFP